MHRNVKSFWTHGGSYLFVKLYSRPKITGSTVPPCHAESLSLTLGSHEGWKPFLKQEGFFKFIRCDDIFGSVFVWWFW